MHEIGLDSIVQRISEAVRDGNIPLADGLLWPALNQKPETGALWFYAGVLYGLRGQEAVAFECFKKSQALEPYHACWANMGGCLRQMGRVEESRVVLEDGLAHAPDDPDILANLCGSYVNEGDPEPGICYGEQLLKVAPVHANGKFNLALLYLEAGRFAEGFDLYAEGNHRLRHHKSYTPDPPFLTPELHEELKGKGKKLIVYGEQGIGDELMFATMLNDASRDYEIIFDCHPRLESLHRHSSWVKRLRHEGKEPVLFPTRKSGDKGWTVEADAKIAIGNLGRYYRRTRESFAWHGPVYSAPPREAREMRKYLEAIAGGRKIIGLSLRGGTMSTMRLYRIIHPRTLDPILSDPRYLFVSLDYEDMTAFGEHIAQAYGPGRFLWYPSVCWAWDYEHQAALVAATDAVVSVCQSIAHLSAAMGHPTYVLTPSRPAWRYGLTDERWYWYNHRNALLLRRTGDDWAPAAHRLKEALQERFPQKEAA